MTKTCATLDREVYRVYLSLIFHRGKDRQRWQSQKYLGSKNSFNQKIQNIGISVCINGICQMNANEDHVANTKNNLTIGLI